MKHRKEKDALGPGKLGQRTSNSPSSRTAINVSSFLDSTGCLIAALVFRSARPNIVRPSCWSFCFAGELPDMTSATEEVAKDKGESGVVFL